MAATNKCLAQSNKSPHRANATKKRNPQKKRRSTPRTLPEGIDITNWFEDPSGGDFQINFDIGTHKFGDGKMMETAHDASLNVLVDGQVVKTINYSDFANHDVMQHISFTVDSAAPDGAKAAHTISFVDTTTSEGKDVGFALDSIVVNDWLI